MQQATSKIHAQSIADSTVTACLIEFSTFRFAACWIRGMLPPITTHAYAQNKTGAAGEEKLVKRSDNKTTLRSTFELLPSSLYLLLRLDFALNLRRPSIFCGTPIIIKTRE